MPPVSEQDLQERVERAVAEALNRRMGEPGQQPSGQHGVGMALGSMALGIPITGAIGALLHGPEAVVGLSVAWAAIAAINVSHALRGVALRRGSVQALGSGPHPPMLRGETDTPPPSPADSLARLPLDVRIRVEQVRSKADLLLQHRDHFPLGSRNLYVLGRIRSAYLPSTLDAYLALGGDDRPVTPDGRTPLQVLRDQLALLDSKLDEIADDLQRENADRLLANLRFLEQHFSSGTEFRLS